MQKVQTTLNEKPGTLLIGPGLGRKDETIEFVRALLAAYSGNVVIDADALFALANLSLLKKPEEAQWILTPHPGELSHLCSVNFSNEEERLINSKELATNSEAIILAKGLPSILALPKGEAILTGYDTRVFARAGFGDVLAGKIVGNWHLKKIGELACLLSLLDGKEKADSHIFQSSEALAPLHII
ncbi:MAG: NAD(P)H-hydrate dehydratase [Balneolaceae bacterium]